MFMVVRLFSLKDVYFSCCIIPSYRRLENYNLSAKKTFKLSPFLVSISFPQTLQTVHASEKGLKVPLESNIWVES